MNYKVKDLSDDADTIFSTQISDSDEGDQSNSCQCYAVDQSLIENLFQYIQISCKTADEIALINQLSQLAQIYSQGKINSLELACKYDFFTVCSEILTMCGNIEVVGNLLNCLCFAIQSDSEILDTLSNPTFTEQLAYCIDEKGSSIYGVGFEILSKAIQGYSKPLFSKICYIFATTRFQDAGLTRTDIENLNYFGKVFTQLSKFATDKSYLIMLIIAKIFILYGLFNYGVEMLMNIINTHEDAKIHIFVLNKLTESQLSEIGKNSVCFYSSFTISNDLTSSFDSIEPSIFLILAKSIPFHKERSQFFDFDFEASIINTLTLINDLIINWGNHYIASLNNIDYNYLYELMIYKESEDIEVNYTIQSLALSIFAEIYSKDKKWDTLLEDSDYAILAIETFAEKMGDMPLKIRDSSLKGICKIIRALTSVNVDNDSKMRAFEIISKFEIVEKIMDFFVSDSRSQIDSAYTLWILIENSEEAKSQALNFLYELEEMENEAEDSEMKAQLHLINLSLKKEDDFPY